MPNGTRQKTMPIVGERWNNDARKTPCWQCKERHHKCHATCERYLKDVEEQKKAKTEIQQAVGTDRFFEDMKKPKSPKRLTVRGGTRCRTSPKR
jgi:response regulator of citrate/malate metabolism